MIQYAVRNRLSVMCFPRSNLLGQPGQFDHPAQTGSLSLHRHQSSPRTRSSPDLRPVDRTNNRANIYHHAGNTTGDDALRPCIDTPAHNDDFPSWHHRTHALPAQADPKSKRHTLYEQALRIELDNCHLLHKPFPAARALPSGGAREPPPPQPLNPTRVAEPPFFTWDDFF